MNHVEKMFRQIEELTNFEDKVGIEGQSNLGYEVTVHYWGPNGMTHFHSNARTMSEAVDRAYKTRMKMRKKE